MSEQARDAAVAAALTAELAAAERIAGEGSGLTPPLRAPIPG